jgi:carboxylesterase
MSDAVAQVIDGCDSVSHHGTTDVGVLVVHGFTGSPYSMRSVSDAIIAAGHHVEAPRLPGHGTSVDDLMTRQWADWYGAADAALTALTDRVERTVVVGQSMGGSLALALALDHPELAGVACINPATRRPGDEIIEMIDDLLEDGFEVAPGEGSDIADPDAVDISYDGTPLRPVRSLFFDGLSAISDRFGDASMPLRLFTSRQDHVVTPADSEHLADRWGGRVEHTWLERSYHVATVDYDRTVVADGVVAFVAEVTS